MTFLATSVCASDFFKMLPKFKMSTRSQLQNFLWVQKKLNLTSEIIQILESHSPQYGDVQVIFLRFCWNLKWPPRINLLFWGVAQTQKPKVVNYSNFTITLSTIWRCACDSKSPSCMNFVLFRGRKNSKIEVRNNVQVILLKFKMATTSRLFKNL